MGFFNSCWEALLQLTSYAQILNSNNQQPLHLPNYHEGNSSLTSPSGVSFQVEGTDFTCQYPSMNGYRNCNNRNDRGCWLEGRNRRSFRYDINTPYDMPGDENAPDGITREVQLPIVRILSRANKCSIGLKWALMLHVHRTHINVGRADHKQIAPDGFLKPLGQVFNHTYPGPHLQACWGDQIVVHVTNKIPNLGTTIHWHGIRQLNTTQQDGVNGVTQCPIAFGETYTYSFRADQIGHTWYHSHYQTQYSDGVAGPLTIYGPSSANWDETFTPIMMQDWVHDNTSIAFKQELGRSIPLADSILLGGTNTFKCDALKSSCCRSCDRSNCKQGTDEAFCCTPDERCYRPTLLPNGTIIEQKQVGGLFNRTFQEGKRYLLQLINASADAMFIFAIDDHELLVIAADLVPIKPYKTDSLFIAIGQRYQVVVTAKPKKKSKACQSDIKKCNYWIRTRIASGCGNVAQDNEETGIIQYSPNRNPRDLPDTEAHTDREECKDEPMEKLRPIVPWNASNLRNSREDYTFVAAFDDLPTHGAYRWELTDKPLFLNYSSPSILNVDNNGHFHDVYQASVNYTNHDWNGGFVYLVIDGSNIQQIAGKQGVPAAHPIHLHGHDFVILAQVDSAFNGTIPKNQVINPARRDTALLYGGGYLALAFKLDNPGVWLVHCHIAWHASSGLALQIIERQDEIIGSIGDLNPTRETCEGWKKMDLKFHQEDSGI